MIDDLIQHTIHARKWKYLTAPILHSVIIQESGGVSTFAGTESIYLSSKLHAKMAMGIITDAQFVPLVTLPNEKLAKFRFEQGQWGRYKLLNNIPRFYMCSSWGLGQCMGFNLAVGHVPSDISKVITTFAADEQAQVNRCGQDMESYLVRAGGNVYHGYCGYNSGDVNSQRADVQARAKEVVSRL